MAKRTSKARTPKVNRAHKALLTIHRHTGEMLGDTPGHQINDKYYFKRDAGFTHPHIEFLQREKNKWKGIDTPKAKAKLNSLDDDMKNFQALLNSTGGKYNRRSHNSPLKALNEIVIKGRSKQKRSVTIPDTRVRNGPHRTFPEFDFGMRENARDQLKKYLYPDTGIPTRKLSASEAQARSWGSDMAFNHGIRTHELRAETRAAIRRSIHATTKKESFHAGVEALGKSISARSHGILAKVGDDVYRNPSTKLRVVGIGFRVPRWTGPALVAGTVGSGIAAYETDPFGLKKRAHDIKVQNAIRAAHTRSMRRQYENE